MKRFVLPTKAAKITQQEQLLLLTIDQQKATIAQLKEKIHQLKAELHQLQAYATTK